jgi:hypothetical protein
MFYLAGMQTRGFAGKQKCRGRYLRTVLRAEANSANLPVLKSADFKDKV